MSSVPQDVPLVSALVHARPVNQVLIWSLILMGSVTPIVPLMSIEMGPRAHHAPLDAHRVLMVLPANPALQLIP